MTFLRVFRNGLINRVTVENFIRGQTRLIIWWRFVVLSPFLFLIRFSPSKITAFTRKFIPVLLLISLTFLLILLLDALNSILPSRTLIHFTPSPR